MTPKSFQEGLRHYVDREDENDRLDRFIENQRKIISSLEKFEYVDGSRFSYRVNFSQARNEPVHRWFKYREGYSPSLVYRFLDNEVRVLDPFCGSGTTLVCAMMKSVDSVGIDINPMASFVARVKTKRYKKSDIEALKRLSKQLLKEYLNAIEPADIPRLRIINKVFPNDVLDYLLRLKTQMNSVEEEKSRDFLFLGWLAILESVSNTRKEGNGIKYRSTKRTKKGYVHIPFDTWRREFYGTNRIGFVKNKLETQLNMMIEDVETHCLGLPYCETKIFTSDASQLSDLIPKDRISTVMFSPPYANCFDYFEIFKVELWMGGFIDNYAHLRELRKNSLGSLWQTNSNNMHACNLEIPELDQLYNLIEQRKLWDKKIVSMLIAYFTNMRKVLSQIYDVLLRTGKCVIVVGNSAYSNVIVPTDLILAKIGHQIGFKRARLIIARHLTTSSQQKKKLEPLKQYLRESIIVLQKQ